MSVHAMAWVWEHSQSKGTARLVLLSLADHAGADGGDAYPSVARIARRCGIGQRTVQAALRALYALGELVVDVQAGPRGANRYRIVMTPADLAPPQISHPADPAPPPRRSRTGGVQILHPTPADLAPEPSLTVIEPSVKRPSRAIATSSPVGFDDFWAAYPLKRAKGAAKVAWVKAVKRATPATITAGALTYANDPHRDPDFTKHPATWLNADCWDDEPAAPRPRLSKGTLANLAWAERNSP